MDHQDHVNLLKDGIPQSGKIWADFGAGQGAFTLALAEVLGPSATIYVIDKDAKALQYQAKVMQKQYPATHMHYQTTDFTRQLQLPLLDGIVAANTLHFVRHKDKVLQLWRGYLKENGRLIIIEYNTDKGNPWVPYPFSYPTWQSLAAQNGFAYTQLLAKRPSRFLGEIYSAVSWS